MRYSSDSSAEIQRRGSTVPSSVDPASSALDLQLDQELPIGPASSEGDRSPRRRSVSAISSAVRGKPTAVGAGPRRGRRPRVEEAIGSAPRSKRFEQVLVDDCPRGPQVGLAGARPTRRDTSA